MKNKKNIRLESDSLGNVEVNAENYWGAQTQRSLKHFSIGNDLIPIEVIHALALLKKSAALANYELKTLPKKKKDIIVKTADEILDNKFNAQFPLHVWMTGSGTQSNMNVNEVISNRSIELLGGKMGSKDPIHPNDDVNMSQSSNDSFPTAMHMATAIEIHKKLLPAVKLLKNELSKKAKSWSHIVKIGRTHLQDAVPLTLGQEFSGYAFLIEKDIQRIEFALKDVYELALGGTAVGTGLNAHPEFSKKACAQIAKYTRLPFVPCKNKFGAQGSHDALVAMSAAIKTLATSLFKIANDIRLMSCGPRAGFNELNIPANEPGSSIMPGKVNPTQCEAMAMVSAQCIGYDTAVSIAGSAGYLEMNVYKPMIIYNLLQSIHMISDTCENFTIYLLKGTKPNKKQIESYVNRSLMLVTVLSPIIGYDKASKLAHYANDHDCSLEEANNVLRFLSNEEFKSYVKPEKMTKGGRVERARYLVKNALGNHEKD